MSKLVNWMCPFSTNQPAFMSTCELKHLKFSHMDLFSDSMYHFYPNNCHFGSYKSGVIHVCMYWIPKLMSWHSACVSITFSISSVKVYLKKILFYAYCFRVRCGIQSGGQEMAVMVGYRQKF